MNAPSSEKLLPPTSDATKIHLGGAFRLPPSAPPKLEAADAGRIHLGGAFRLPA